MPDIYDTNVLIAMVDSLKVSQNFLLDTFFPNEIREDSEEISFDVDEGKRRISPFVAPLVQGKAVRTRGFRTDTFKPAYVKDKRVLDPDRPLKRRRGERIGGGMPAGSREQMNLADELEDQTQMLDRRLEVMAADAMQDGILTVKGEDYPAVTVDFGRHADLTISLAGGAQWGETGVSPYKDIETWGKNIMRHSGAVPNTLVFGYEAWDLYLADPKVEAALDVRRGGGSTIELGSQPAIGPQFKGRVGNYNCWTYCDWYVDPDDDVEKPILDDYGVLIGSPQIEGVQQFGAIRDPRAGYRALRFFPKSWIDEDPPVRYLMLQSAPLVVPSRVNAGAGALVRTA